MHELSFWKPLPWEGYLAQPRYRRNVFCYAPNYVTEGGFSHSEKEMGVVRGEVCVVVGFKGKGTVDGW